MSAIPFPSSPSFPSRPSARPVALLVPALLAIVWAESVCSGSALASPPDPTPIEVFERHYSDRDPKIRRKAVQQLSESRGPEVVAALVTALADEDETVLRAARQLLRRAELRAAELRVLAEQRRRSRDAGVRREIVRLLGAVGADAAPALLTAFEDRDPGVREDAARALGTAGASVADDVLPALHELRRDPADLVRAASIEAIGARRGGEATGAACAVLRGDRATTPRVAAALVLAAHPLPQAVEHLTYGLRTPAWSLRVACARALGAQREDKAAARAAAAVLVPALDTETRMRVAEEMSSALFSLTGIDFGPDPARWRAWFDEAGTSFVPPERAPYRAAPTPGGTQAGLLDLPTESDHVTFVLDGSHSMSDAIRFGAETTKQDALLAAFERALNRLPEDSWANLIPFGSEPVAYKPSLFRATPAARRQAVRFLAKRAPDGRTNIYDSLVLALADDDVDTLVLVTDGAPSEGARTTRTDILEGLHEMNRYRLVRVHTVEIGARSTSPRWRGFLADIAAATGGHYLER